MIIDSSISLWVQVVLWILEKVQPTKHKEPPKTLIVFLKKKGFHWGIDRMEVKD